MTIQQHPRALQTIYNAWIGLPDGEMRRQTLTCLARLATQREWDVLFPPRLPDDFEPQDATGFSEDVEILIIGG